MNKKWEVNEADDILISKISDEFNVSRLVANIIANTTKKKNQQMPKNEKKMKMQKKKIPKKLKPLLLIQLD